MSDHYNIGDYVKWKWGSDWARGKVQERFTGKVSRTIKGSEVTRNASNDDPAYLIEQADRDRVLKSHRELQKS